MLRKNLGDSRVGHFILNNGIPKILDLPLRSKKAPHKALLQNMLDELMQWHVSLLQSIVTKKEDPNMAIAIKLSDINEGEWRKQRREIKEKAKQRLNSAKRLSMQKESGKRKWDDMSPYEQQSIEEYETQKLQRAYKATCIEKPEVSIRILA